MNQKFMNLVDSDPVNTHMPICLKQKLSGIASQKNNLEIEADMNTKFGNLGTQ